MARMISPLGVDRLMEELRLHYGGDAAAAERRFMAPICREAIELINAAPRGGAAAVSEYAAAILARIGDSLPAMNDRRRITCAVLLWAAAHGVFGGSRVAWVENN